MNKDIFIRNNLRDKLKKPLGIFIEKNIKKKIKKILGDGRLIIVGDISYSKLKSLKPKLSIIDFHSRRTKQTKNIKYDFKLINPPGSISKDSWSIIKFALNSSSRKIIYVYGEEDLLALPCILIAKENDVVVYGLNNGVVAVKVNDVNKKIAKYFIEQMSTKKFDNVVASGTFDRFHKGHRYFLKTASFYGKKLLVGITSDEMIRKKSKQIKSFETRKKSVERYLKHLKVKYKIYEINDKYGFCITNPQLYSIVATQENLNVVKKINKKRKSLGMRELTIFVLPYVVDKNGRKISSRYIRLKEMKRKK